MKFSRAAKYPQDKENCGRNANRSANRRAINQQNMKTLEETCRKMTDRQQRRSAQRPTTIKKATHNEDIYASPLEKSERMMHLLFMTLDEKNHGYLSKNNLSCYRLAAPVYRIIVNLLIEIVEGTNPVDYRQFRRRVMSQGSHDQLYDLFFMEPDLN